MLKNKADCHSRLSLKHLHIFSDEKPGGYSALLSKMKAAHMTKSLNII